MKKSVLFAVLALATFSAGSVASSTLLCPQQTDRTYYSDAAMTEVAGEVFIDCSGTLYRWGRVTAYSTVNYLPCNCGPVVP